MVEKILMVILVLVAILVLYQLFAPWIGGVNWWGRGPGPSIAILFGSHAITAAMVAAGMLLIAGCAARAEYADFGPMPPPNATAAQAQTPHGRTICIDGGATETCYRITVTPK